MNNPEGSTVEQKGQGGPLILQRAAIARRVDALFKAMSTDFLLREQFITDPAQITSEYVYSTKMSLQKASIINQLVYSIMSNQSLLNWLRDYAIKYSNHPPTTPQFMSDFGRAVVEHDGHHIVFALARGALEKDNVFNFDETLLPTIFSFFTGGSTLAAGTEMSTGTGGTEMSTGQLLAARPFAAGTEMSTGTGGTEMSTGTGGTEMSTGQQLEARLFAAGTEMSTGTGGTEMSTGTGGTEMSTGQQLEAQLFAAGTEMSTGGGGTEMSTGTLMSTGQQLEAQLFAAGTEMSTGTGGTEMSTGTLMSTGQLLAARPFEAGTEMSTGTGGTEMSTGTGGTEMSTGQRLSNETNIFRSGFQAVTLEALAQYATHLREIGALDVIQSQ